MTAQASEVPVPFRVRLRLEDLVLAARLAGDVPLPVRVDQAGHRLSDRLAGTPVSQAREAIAEALSRVDDDGPAGARAALTLQGLLDDEGVLEPLVGAALTVLATGALGAVLDVAAVRATGTSRLRSWFGVTPALVAQLSTADGREYEFAWYAPSLWISQVTRAASVEPWALAPAPMALPDYVQLPSELLAGSEKAYREQRSDLVPVMAQSHPGRVRLGEPGEVHVADTDEVLGLLATLGRACRGRLRLTTLRRDVPDAAPSVAAWLLFDDGWHELRPGRDATAVLRRRTARDLGVLSFPVVEALTEGAA